MHCTATCMQSPASIHLQMTRIPHRETNKYTYVSSNMYNHIKNTARPPVENLCWWVNLLHCMSYSSIQGTNLILFHLQRSSGVRRWVALRKKTHKSASLWSLCEEQGSTRSHTKWNFKINDWAVIYNSPPGQRKVRKHFNQSLRLCYAAMNQLFKGQNSWTAARERLWMISHQNIEHIERYIPESMKLGFKFFLICAWFNLSELCSAKLTEKQQSLHCFVIQWKYFKYTVYL